MNSPVLIEFLPSDSSSENITFSKKLLVLSGSEFQFQEELDQKVYQFGDTIQNDYGKLIFKTTPSLHTNYYGLGLLVSYIPVISASAQLLGNLSIVPTNKEASVLQLTMRDSDLARAKFVLEELLKQHNEDAIDDKNHVAKNTSDFITSRISFVLTELSDVEGLTQEFKQDNSLTDIVSDARMKQEAMSRNDAFGDEYRNRIILTELLLAELNSKANEAGLIPMNLGLVSDKVDELIHNHNELALEYERVLKFSGREHPHLSDLFGKLVSAKANIIESLEIALGAMKTRLRQIEIQDSKIKNEIREMPSHERVFRDMQRQQQVKESLYLYLLQKREEANIALAVTVSNLRIIDLPYGSDAPISPNTGMITIGFLSAGIIIPIILIYLIVFFDSKVRSKKDLTALDIPYLGEIPEMNVPRHPIFSAKDRSLDSESFRIVKANLGFILSESNPGGKVVFISSTISQEGKSFIGINIAEALSASGKSVVLVGADLRHPKLHKYLNIELSSGLSSYLSDINSSFSDAIVQFPDKFSFSLMGSGPVPPNPNELLGSDRMMDLLAQLRLKYDYIIVDTAPVGLVSDLNVISDLADATIFIVRANHLEKRQLSVLQSLKDSNRMKCLCLLLNAYNPKNSADYGYGYGYG
ncbi:MAG: GumC family protein, partial [Flavobacteriales bacterium]